MEQYAGRELCGYLQKLYGIRTAPTEEAAVDSEVAILIGSPKTNPEVAKALGAAGWPEVTDQGIVIKRAEPLFLRFVFIYLYLYGTTY